MYAEPKAATSVRDPRFGVVQAIENPARAVQIGATWERIIFPWERMEPKRGDLQPGYFSEQQIRDQVSRGFTEVGVIIYTPAWATKDPSKAWAKFVPKNISLPFFDPENYWASFTGRLAARYRGVVDHWVIWNEPDIYDTNGRFFFDGSFEEYYQMLKVAYQAIKTNNPQAKVILAGMNYLLDNANNRPPYLASLLEVAGRDSSARANNWYFDIVATHAYASPLASYAMPSIYRQIMQARGITKPIWIMESNAVPGDDPQAPATPGSFRASMEEQASYMIQSYALGIAAGVERQAVYKLLDDKPEAGQYFGLVRNDGSVRPAFVAYQTAVDYLSNARWASYDWSGSQTPPADGEMDGLLRTSRGRTYWTWPGAVNRVVVERGDRRTTVVWNASTKPQQAYVQAAARSGLAVTQEGQVGEVVAGNGFYNLDLPPTVHNADPNDRGTYLIGGRPWIIEERVRPLPETVLTRIERIWGHNNALPGDTDFANVSAQLLTEDGSEPVPCRWEPRVALWRSVENLPFEVVAIGRKEMVQAGEVLFPIWRFDNVRVSQARTGATLAFTVTVDGVQLKQEYQTYARPEEGPIPVPSPGATPSPTPAPTGTPAPVPPPPVSCR
jgi:hypothetical protein